MAWYVVMVVAVALERLAELSRRNLAWSRADGGVEFGAGHQSVMVTLHTGLVAACLVDGVVRSSPRSAGLCSQLWWPHRSSRCSTPHC
jgi:methyltransferase